MPSARGCVVGFDDHRTLGPREQGARVALPIWVDFMAQALDDRPVAVFPGSPLLTRPKQVKEIPSHIATRPVPVGRTPP